MINTVLFCYGGEYLAGLGDGYSAHLGHVALRNIDNENVILFLRIGPGYIEVHRGRIQYITVCCLHLNQRVTLAVGQLFGGDQSAIGIGVESIYNSNLGIGILHCYQIAFRIVDLESGTGIRNGLAGGCVGLCNLDVGLKLCVVDDVAVHLLILGDGDLEGGNVVSAFPAGELVYNISTVG